jgi:hypothetical protein
MVKVRVADGWQVKHGGKNFTGGDTFEASDADAKKLVASGLVKAVSGSKNKAMTPDDAGTKDDGTKSSGLAELSVKDLQQLAADKQIEGRSSMNKDELVAALGG